MYNFCNLQMHITEINQQYKSLIKYTMPIMKKIVERWVNGNMYHVYRKSKYDIVNAL